MKGIVRNSFTLNLTVMKLMGTYPLENYPRLYKVFGYFLYIFSMIPGSIFGFIHLFFKGGITDVGYKDLFSVVVVVFLSPKLFSLVIAAENIKKCIIYLDEGYFIIRNQNQEKIITECVQICRRNSIFFLGGCATCFISWTATLIYQGDMKQLPLLTWLPFNSQDYPLLHYVLYFSYYFGAAYLVFASGAVDPLIVGLICHAFGQVQILKDNLQHLDDYIDESRGKSDLIYEKIKKCIDNYEAITNFIFKYEKSFSTVILCQFLESAIVIGICCLQISKLKDDYINLIITGNYLVILLIQVYFYCYYGTLLVEENNSLITAIYMSRWYEYTKESQKALLILMECSKKPLLITAGRVVGVSLETFTLILKRSYSLLAVLKNY
ncbi:odorant receptor 33b-like [Tribolium madens]|uniref:odorant receptor 33b-like n=1 Tax=Tribolium madens TaxID=41895 RepID=UPI001CF725D3|nr:odorant receptor 33b-like [Tribolium madens]